MAEPATTPESALEGSMFEQPLNERMRTFLRLDFLYSQALYHNERGPPWGSRAAVDSLLDILAILTRGDSSSRNCARACAPESTPRACAR